MRQIRVMQVGLGWKLVLHHVCGVQPQKPVGGSRNDNGFLNIQWIFHGCAVGRASKL